MISGAEGARPDFNSIDGQEQQNGERPPVTTSAVEGLLEKYEMKVIGRQHLLQEDRLDQMLESGDLDQATEQILDGQVEQDRQEREQELNFLAAASEFYQFGVERNGAGITGSDEFFNGPASVFVKSFGPQKVCQAIVDLNVRNEDVTFFDIANVLGGSFGVDGVIGALEKSDPDARTKRMIDDLKRIQTLRRMVDNENGLNGDIAAARLDVLRFKNSRKTSFNKGYSYGDRRIEKEIFDFVTSSMPKEIVAQKLDKDQDPMVAVENVRKVYSDRVGKYQAQMQKIAEALRAA